MYFVFDNNENNFYLEIFSKGDIHQSHQEIPLRRQNQLLNYQDKAHATNSHCVEQDGTCSVISPTVAQEAVCHVQTTPAQEQHVKITSQLKPV